MIGVTGGAVQNTSPPSMAMLAFGATPAGSTLMVAPMLDRALKSVAMETVAGGGE